VSCVLSRACTHACPDERGEERGEANGDTKIASRKECSELYEGNFGKIPRGLPFPSLSLSRSSRRRPSYDLSPAETTRGGYIPTPPEMDSGRYVRDIPIASRRSLKSTYAERCGERERERDRPDLSRSERKEIDPGDARPPRIWARDRRLIPSREKGWNAAHRR